jgi:hypothetical protein
MTQRSGPPPQAAHAPPPQAATVPHTSPPQRGAETAQAPSAKQAPPPKGNPPVQQQSQSPQREQLAAQHSPPMPTSRPQGAAPQGKGPAPEHKEKDKDQGKPDDRGPEQKK